MFKPIPSLSEKYIMRFWSYVHKGLPDECWEWQGGKFIQGYGGFHINRDVFRSNRVAYFIAHGTISDSLLVCHSCDNRLCCNPKHLFQGTSSDNVQDMLNKGRHWFQTQPELRKRGRAWHKLHPRNGRKRK